MCDNKKDIEESKKIFLNAKTVVEFMNTWSLFYENKICIPTYLAKFVGGEDNPQASFELGKKLKEIAIRGFLAIDSQVTIPGNQKGYIIGYIPKNMANMVVENLNRYSGIIDFYNDIRDFDKEDIKVVESLVVTYDALDDEIETSAKNRKMTGIPQTFLTSNDINSFEDIRTWMSDKVKKKIKAKNYKYVTIISPCFDSPAELIFDKLLEVMRQI